MANSANAEAYKHYITEVLSNKKDKMDSLLKTKRLIFNNNKYLIYRKNYANITIVSDFKQPITSKYPITTNANILPLSMQQFQCDCLNKKNAEKNESEKRSNIKSIFKIRDTNSFNITKDKYYLNEDNIFNKTQGNYKPTQNTVRQNSKKYISKIKKLMENKLNRDFFNSDKHYIFTSPSDNKTKKIEFDTGNLLYNLLLSNEEDNYSELNYEESLIFNDYFYYNTFLIDKLNKLKQFGIEDNAEVEKIKKLGDDNEENIFLQMDNRFELKLASFKIEISKINTQENKKFEFVLPFDVVPLFYYENMQHIPLILIGLFKYKNDNFELDLSQLINILNNSEFIKIPKNNPGRREYLKNKKNLKKHIKQNYNSDSFHNFNRSKNNKIEHSIQNNNKTCNSKEQKHLRKMVSLNIDSYDYKYNDLHKKSRTQKNLNFNPEIHCLYKEMWNNLNIFWLTNDKNKYKITIKVPEIELKIDKMLIKKYMNNELLFLLIQNNFYKWEFYVLKYLLSYKIFRSLMQMYYSNINYSYQDLINISKKEVFPDYIDITEENDNGIKYIINLSKPKKIMSSMKTKNFYFIYSDSNSTYYKLLHNFLLHVRNKDIHPVVNKFNFLFNYEQMKKINHISKKQSLCSFFAKILENDSKNMKVKLNYDLLDRYKYSDNKNLAKHEPNLSPEHLCLVLGKKKGGNKISVKRPILETIEYIPESSEKFHGNCFISNINDFEFQGMSLKRLDVLCKEDDIENWPQILIDEIDNIK